MLNEVDKSTDSELSMQDLLFVIELSLMCLEISVRAKKEVVNPSILAEVEYAIAHYIRCALVCHFGMNAKLDETINLSGTKEDLIGYSPWGLLDDVMNHGRQVIDKVKKIESIEEQIRYLFSTVQDDFASRAVIERMDQVINTNRPLTGNLADEHLYDELIKRAKITATEEWSIKYMPKVDLLRKKSERINELILNYSYDDCLYHWIAVVNKAITVVAHKLDGSFGKSQMIGVLFLLTLFKEAGLNVKDEHSLKEFLETMLGIDKKTAKTYLHRLKNKNETLYKARDGYFDMAIEQIKVLFNEDTELRRKLIQDFESYKKDRQIISEVLPPNRLTKND